MNAPLLRTCSLFVTAVFCSGAMADESSVKSMIQEYVNAFNSRDLESVMGFWSEDAVHIDHETGSRTEGREAIRSDIVDSFTKRPDTRLAGSLDRLRFVTPEVARIEGKVTMTNPNQDPVVTDFQAILIGSNGKWLIDTIEERPVPKPASAYEALQELKWLIGSWIDATDGSRIENVFRWSENGSFLIRSFAMVAPDGNRTQGTQVIGWDPRSQEIRSWTFNSDGSFGDATWAKSGEDWLIKSSQTLVAGEAASGTFILSREGEDQMTLRLIGHEIEGEPQPAGRAVTVVRQREVQNVSDETAADAPAQ